MVKQTAAPCTLALDGTPQTIASTKDLGIVASGEVTCGWEGRSLVTRFKAGPKQLPCMLKRTLHPEKHVMVLKLLCEDFTATRAFIQVDEDGDPSCFDSASGNPYDVAKSIVRIA